MSNLLVGPACVVAGLCPAKAGQSPPPHQPDPCKSGSGQADCAIRPWPANYFRDLSSGHWSSYFGHRAILSHTNEPRSPEVLVKRGSLIFLSFVLVAGSVQAEKAPSGPALDDIFLWLAGGLSSARIQRLADTGLACRITPPCIRALQKSGASPALIQDLARPSGTHQNARHRSAAYPEATSQSGRKKSATTASCTCGSAAGCGCHSGA